MTRRDGTMQPDMFAESYELTLTAAELERLRRPIAPGNWGGYQYLADQFQQREKHGRLTVTEHDLEKAYAYAYQFGSGTWQRYFRVVVSAGMRAGWMPEQDLVGEVARRQWDVLARHVGD